ncbi:hypothetical protein ACJMK2_018181 [Sinanodonta woodiana]|uniref:Uncharacterized protein n=1 Tax=Sinanodonta woodiana TaxID=1069815 RepID=A0ABD3UE72_SINWO
MTRRLSLNSTLTDVIARKGLDSVAALLDGDRRAPSNNYILDRSASRSRMVGSTSVEDEVKSLFRGPSANFISHELYMVLTEGIASIQPTPNEICDYELSGQVEAIAAATNEEDFKAAVVKAVELINLAGCMNLTLHLNQDEQTTLVKSLTKFVVCERIKHWKEFFIFTIKPLDALQLDNMFDVKWLTEGSNRKCIERILVYWRDFLQDLEEGQGELFVTLKDLLAFTTGADEVPAHGFNFPLQLSFIHPEDLQDVAKCCTAGFIHPEDLQNVAKYCTAGFIHPEDLQDVEKCCTAGFIHSEDLQDVAKCCTAGFIHPEDLQDVAKCCTAGFIHPEGLQDVAKCCTAGFPYANTCTMKLKIPVVNDYNTFQRNMAAAISVTVTFTNQ